MLRTLWCCAVLFALMATAACGGEGPARPYAAEGHDEVREDSGIRRFVVNLTHDEKIYFKHHEFDLASGDRGEIADAVQALHEELRRFVGLAPSLREKTVAYVPVLGVFYDPGTPVKHLCWMVYATRHPDIQVADLRLVAKAGAR